MGLESVQVLAGQFVALLPVAISNIWELVGIYILRPHTDSWTGIFIWPLSSWFAYTLMSEEVLV